MNPHPWLEIAESKLGQHEIPGPEANSFIVECLESTTLGTPENQSDETAWCSAFVNWCITQSGLQGTNSAWARSWLEWGRTPESEDEWTGAVCVLERGPTSGHVGFLVDWEDDWVRLLGGNQGDSVSYVWFPMDRVLGYRVPA
jgi:uncharacterized protein (TIGR02594 family)